MSYTKLIFYSFSNWHHNVTTQTKHYNTLTTAWNFWVLPCRNITEGEKDEGYVVSGLVLLVCWQFSRSNVIVFIFTSSILSIWDISSGNLWAILYKFSPCDNKIVITGEENTESRFLNIHPMKINNTVLVLNSRSIIILVLVVYLV